MFGAGRGGIDRRRVAAAAQRRAAHAYGRQARSSWRPASPRPCVASNVGMLLFAAIAIGGTFMVMTMAGMQEARRVAGNAAPRLIAAMTAAFALGQLLGPLVVSVLPSSPHALHVSSIAAAALLIAGAALLTASHRPR